MNRYCKICNIKWIKVVFLLILIKSLIKHSLISYQVDKFIIIKIQSQIMNFIRRKMAIQNKMVIQNMKNFMIIIKIMLYYLNYNKIHLTNYFLIYQQLINYNNNFFKNLVKSLMVNINLIIKCNNYL
jgi:hypothetical protein